MVNIHANNKTKTKTKTKTAIKKGGGSDVMPASPKKKKLLEQIQEMRLSLDRQ